VTHLHVLVTGDGHHVTLHLPRSCHVTCKQYPCYTDLKGMPVQRGSRGIVLLFLVLGVTWMPVVISVP
jgi:hypothetical protein